MREHLLFNILLVIMIIMSLVTFILYSIDKKRAIKHRYRIKESVLLISTIMFGSVGAFFGIYTLRHKTKHWYFPLTMIISMAIHITLLIFVY